MRKMLSNLIAALLMLASVPAFAQQSGSGAWNFVLSPTITPVATAAAIGVSQQTFAFPGLPATGADVIVLPTVVPTALCPMIGGRISALNTLQIDFQTMTAAACTPAAGQYGVLIRTR